MHGALHHLIAVRTRIPAVAGEDASDASRVPSDWTHRQQLSAAALFSKVHQKVLTDHSPGAAITQKTVGLALGIPCGSCTPLVHSTLYCLVSRVCANRAILHMYAWHVATANANGKSGTSPQTVIVFVSRHLVIDQY